MTVKERVLEKIEAMNDAELMELEQYIASLGSGEKDIARTLKLIKLFAEKDESISPEAWREFDEATTRRPLFGGRAFEVEPDEEEELSV